MHHYHKLSPKDKVNGGFVGKEIGQWFFFLICIILKKNFFTLSFKFKRYFLC